MLLYMLANFIASICHAAIMPLLDWLPGGPYIFNCVKKKKIITEVQNDLNWSNGGRDIKNLSSPSV